MLSSPQAKGNGTLLTPHHHFTSITQPVIGAGPRKKDRRDSIVNTRRDSFNPPHLTIHRPLRVLNGDRHPGPNRSAGKVIDHHPNEGHRRASLSIQEQIQIGHHTPCTTLKIHRNDHYRLPHELTREILPSMQTVLRKPNPLPSKPLTKITRSIPSSRPMTRMTDSSQHQTMNQMVKHKAATPIGHYPIAEQIRAHINRSVIEKQHPEHLPPPSQRRVLQQIIPLDVPPSNAHTLVTKQSTIIVHTHTTVRGDGPDTSPTQNPRVPPVRHPKQTLPVFPNLAAEDNRQRNSITNNPKDQTRTKGSPESVKVPHQTKPSDTPRSYYIIPKNDKNNNRHQPAVTDRSKCTSTIQRQTTNDFHRQQPILTDPKPTRPKNRNKNRTGHRHRNISTRTDHDKPSEIITNTLLPTTRIQPKQSNESVQTKPSSTNVDYQIGLDAACSSKSSSACFKSHSRSSCLTYRLNTADGQQSLQEKPLVPVEEYVLQPLLNTKDLDSIPRAATITYPSFPVIEHRCSASSSRDYSFSRKKRPLSLDKVPLPTSEEADISIIDDTDDGWSDDSIEIIYIDERYLTKKKKIIASSYSSSSYLIFQPHTHLQTQQQDILLR